MAKAKTAVDLATKVAEQIKKLGPDVEEGLISARVTRELNKRTTALDQAWEKLERMQKDRRKMRPDVITYGADKEDGTEGDKQESWSSNAIKARKELDEKIGKLEKAISKALDEADFSEVYKYSDNPKPGNPEAGA